MSANLIKYDGNDGIELYIDEETGLAYAHQSAICRMLPEASRTTIQRRLQGCPKDGVKTAEIQTAGGMQGCPLYPASVVFKLAIEFNPSLAEAMGAAGANVYMLGLAGYQVSVAPAIKQDPVEMALALAAAYTEHAKNLQEIALQAKQIKLLEEDNVRQAEVIDELFDYSSIIRIAKYNGCDEKAFSWHRLRTASKTIGAEIKKVPCPRYETKNLYSHDAWRLAYPGYKLPETTTLVVNPN